jgi:hypothetical protein
MLEEEKEATEIPGVPTLYIEEQHSCPSWSPDKSLLIIPNLRLNMNDSMSYSI